MSPLTVPPAAAGLHCRLATPADAEALLELMRAFYAEDRIAYDAPRVTAAVRLLLEDARHGQILLLERDTDRHLQGYVALTLGFSLEQGGRYALLDELYLCPAARGQGWAPQLLGWARTAAQQLGAGTLRLEVHHHNAKAKGLYLASGYADDHRDLLTQRLAD